MTRLNWIDISKTAAIFGVVVLHTHCDPLLSKCINGFIMPLFFIISGYLFSYERNPSYGAFVKKRFRQLVVPYLWINAVAYLAWLMVLRHYGADADNGRAWYSPLIGIAGGIPPLLVHDIPLWSLMSFFFVEVIFYPLYKRLRSLWPIMCIGVAVSYAIATFIPDEAPYLPLAIGPTAAGLAFYALGQYMRDHERNLGFATGYAALLVSILIFAWSVTANDEVEFYISLYGNYALYLLSSVSGSLAVIIAARKIGAVWSCRLIRFISYSTLIICGFHLLMFSAIKGVMLYGAGIEPDELTAGIARGLTFAMAALLLCLPVSWLIKRYARWLVDK